jgi:hypothetical protein
MTVTPACRFMGRASGMAKRLDYEKVRRRHSVSARSVRKVEVVPVHPNSMAARKWGRKVWRRDVGEGR